MLADIREIKVNGEFIEQTPTIIPSFSSKGFPDINKIIELHSSIIAEVGVLISAFDIAREKVKNIPEYSPFIILDSGGYECSQFKDLSDNNTQNYRNTEWGYNELVGVLDSWDTPTTTISVSYDHPNKRCCIARQIEAAIKQFEGRKFGKLILIKPSTENSIRIDMKELLGCIYEFRNFDILGVTEKELGFSIFERMKNIAKIRTALANAGINIPIHVFGSLDTISTPLYFFSGADIFDGLTWLRYAYHNGMATYMQNFSALKHGIRVNDENIPPLIWSGNYQILLDLQITMQRYITEKSFDAFGGVLGPFFEKSFKELEANLFGGKNGRQ